MPNNAPHPTPEQLNAYVLGHLPEPAAAQIDDHISECTPCCETLAGLTSEDTFVGQLQDARRLQQHHGDTRISGRSVDKVPQEVSAALSDHPRYEVLELIGKGGMGDVYKARHRMMKRTVALKVIKPEFIRNPEAVDRFHREVTTAARLSHANIVTAHDAEQAGDLHYLVMEYVKGIDLARTISERGVLPIAEACEYVRQVATGLQYAHEQGMVHRDIKPHNLMVTADGQVQILDFGLASLAPETLPDEDGVAEVRGQLTAAGAIMGTPDFISPEQANDAHSADIRSDIYSLGATFYFLLSGRPLFADGSVTDKLRSHAQFEPESLHSLRDDVPVDLAAIISKMVAKDPDERFQTPVEVADALSKLRVAARDAASSKIEVDKARPVVMAWTIRRILTLLAVAVPSALALGLLGLKGCSDSAQKTQNAYTDLSSYLKSGTRTTHNTYSMNALNVLTDSSEGRRLLAKIDADSEELSFANFEDSETKHAIDWAAALIHDDRVTPRQRELTVTVQHKTGSYGSVGSAPKQIHLENARITRGGGFSGPRLVIGFVTSDKLKDRPVVQETLQLKPGTRYQVDVDLVDVIDGSINWIDLWRNAKEQARDVSVKTSDGG